MKAKRAQPKHSHCARRGYVIKARPRPRYPGERDPEPIVQEAEWALRPVETGAEQLTPTGIRAPDCSARSKTLQGLRHLRKFIYDNNSNAVLHNIIQKAVEQY